MSEFGSFKFVFVPTDVSVPITVHNGDKAGGLDKDDVRLSAEDYFMKITSQEYVADQASSINAYLQAQGVSHNPLSSGMSRLAASVEIVSLLLPSADNNFIGVSLYCDQNGKNKNFEVNKRATSIANLCGHATTIYGDAFFGRYHDDESKPWLRLDFDERDLSSDAPWIKEAATKNSGKRLGSYTTSGMLQNMLKQNNTAFIDSENPTAPAATATAMNEPQGNEYITWSQTSDEVEVRVQLPVVVKAAQLDVKIKANKLQVLLKSGQAVYPNNSSSSATTGLDQIIQAGGATLWDMIDTDSSAWTLEKQKDNNASVVVCTLCKGNSNQWSNLTK